MNAVRGTTWVVGAVAMLGMARLNSPAIAAVIDDFDTPGLAGYDFIKVLDQGDGTTNISFSDAGGTIDVASTGSSGAEQVLFFRNDGITLERGKELQLDAPTAFNNRDFGIAIGEDHADLGNGVAGDNRNTGDYLFMAWRTLSQLNSRGFNNSSEVTLQQEFGANAEKLFIARLVNDDIELGWYDGDTRNVSWTATPATLDIFNNVGFYADVRGDGDGFTGADNLAIVPEPACLTLAGLGVAGALAMRARRRP